MSRITLLNAVGVAVSAGAWAAGMGWRMLLVAGVFAWALVVTRYICNKRAVPSLRADFADYLRGSSGWHLMALPAVGVGDWKLVALGIAAGLAVPALFVSAPRVWKFFYEESDAASHELLMEWQDVLCDELEGEEEIDARQGYVALSLAAHAIGVDPSDVAALQLARSGGGLFVLSHDCFPLARTDASFELDGAAIAGDRSIYDTLDQVFIPVDDLAKHLQGVSKQVMEGWAGELLLFLRDRTLLEDLPSKYVDRWGQPLEDVLEALEASLTPETKAWLERKIKAEARKNKRAADAATPPTPTSSTFERELGRGQEGMDAPSEPGAAAAARASGSGPAGPFGDLIELLKVTGDPSPKGIDWAADWKRHIQKVVSAVVYAGFTLRHLHAWPASDDPASPDHVRWSRRCLTAGELIWEWERGDGEEPSCSMLFLTTLSYLTLMDGEEAYEHALRLCALDGDGGLVKSVSGRFSVAEDLLRLVCAYWEDVIEKLGEEFPLGDGHIDGDAAHDDLMRYMETRAGAELAILHFILTAGIDASEIEGERVSGALERLLPASRQAFVEGWCGSAGFA